MTLFRICAPNGGNLASAAVYRAPLGRLYLGVWLGLRRWVFVLPSFRRIT